MLGFGGVYERLLWAAVVGQCGGVIFSVELGELG